MYLRVVKIISSVIFFSGVLIIFYWLFLWDYQGNVSSAFIVTVLSGLVACLIGGIALFLVTFRQYKIESKLSPKLVEEMKVPIEMTNRVKFFLAPFSLDSKYYWNLLNNRRLLVRKVGIISISGIIAYQLIPVILTERNFESIIFAVLGIFLGMVLVVFRYIMAVSARVWWWTCTLTALLLASCIVYATIMSSDVGLILILYFSIAHFVALLRVGKILTHTEFENISTPNQAFFLSQRVV